LRIVDSYQQWLFVRHHGQQGEHGYPSQQRIRGRGNTRKREYRAQRVSLACGQA
jgi:hypothetical protein